MYKCVIFDLDGTLANTYQGIYNAYEYAAKNMNISFTGDSLVKEAIGAPLLSVFKEKFFLNENDALTAVEFYRKYYAETGKLEATAYDGILQTLVSLKEEKYLLGVATLKRENFAKEILKELNLAKYFDVIYGMDENDQLTKANLLKKCILQLQVRKEDTLLVGDSIYDQIGANEAEIDFMAVTYGFGFCKQSDFHESKFVAKSASEIFQILNNVS